ncbi:MAG TPA: peptide-methionine (R)-S-oxide reductase MsrB [Bauldia sp.]|nr:peptide-methionine (R)-S-oxide reductase MsrB [Bauldia sp.]
MHHESGSTRRTLLFTGAAAAALVAVGILPRLSAGAGATHLGTPGEVEIEEFDAAGMSLGRRTVAKIVKSEEEWRRQLSEIAFAVTRQEGTERAFTGPWLDNHEKGIYRCVCCETALFSSETKYESGTGWPSFWAPIAKGNVLDIEDRSHGMVRVANSCARCEAHLGHVFPDGPPPTGLRYCMNGVALSFVPFAA